jgi:hypothetical protein
MGRIYDRVAQMATADRFARLNRKWKLHRAPMTVACRQLGVNENGLAALVCVGKVKAFRGRGGQILYDIAAAAFEERMKARQTQLCVEQTQPGQAGVHKARIGSKVDSCGASRIAARNGDAG